jgi:hypothetical protein
MKYLISLVFASGLLFSAGVTFAGSNCCASCTVAQCAGVDDAAVDSVDVSADTVAKTQ